jgi:O-antigen/teichoic acid export membrane protein
MNRVRDLFQSFGATAIIQAINVATGILAGRLLGPDGRGELAIVMLWIGLLAELGSLGLYDAVMYRASTDAAKPRALFAASGGLIVLISLALWAIGIVALPIAMASKDPEVLSLAMFYMVGYLPTYFGALLLSGLFQGRFDTTTWNVLRILVPVGYLAGILIAYAAGWATVGGFLLATVCAHVLAVAVACVAALSRGWFALRPDPAVMRSLVAYGWRAHIGDLLQAVRTRLDQMAIAVLLADSDMGLYAVALTIANAPIIFANTIAYVAFPAVSSAGTIAEKRSIFCRYLRVSAVMAVAILIAIYAVDDWLIPALFGAAFAPSARLCDVLALGLVPYTLKLLYMQGLKAWDRPLVASRAELAGLIAVVIALPLLVPTYGAIGAAWSLVIAHLVATAVGALMFHRITGTPVMTALRPSREDWRDLRTLTRMLRR